MIFTAYYSLQVGFKGCARCMSSLFTQPRRREILRTSHSRKFAEKVRKIVHLGDAQPTLGRVGCLCPCIKLEKVPMETIVDRSTLEVLRAGLRGTACAPGEEGYDEARKAWNLNAHQHPALVVMAAGAADVISAARLARERGLGVGVLATGHGVASACDGGVLINTSRMRGVRVDPESQTARVEPGALWRDVIPEGQVFGLAGLLGSSSGVGVVGYTMGGGFGWLGRKYGFNADSVREADVVTADGEL